MNLTILQWNVRSFRQQKPHLLHAIDIMNPHVICLQETQLKPTHDAKLSGYHYPPLRNDRINRKGGGVAIFIKNTIAYEPINYGFPLESVGVTIHLPNKKINIYSLYIPPDTTITTLKTPLENFFKNINSPYIITMDSNAHHNLWGSDKTDARGHLIADIVEDSSGVLLNTGQPTYLSSSGTYSNIDLTICSPQMGNTLQWATHHDNFNSDHFPICISTSLELQNIPPSPHWRFHKADWPLFNSNINFPTNFSTTTQACEAITKSILTAANKAIPFSASSHQYKSAYWWTTECQKARKAKNTALTRYKHNQGDLKLWILYKKARAIFRKTVVESRRHSWSSFLRGVSSDAPSSTFWRQVKILRNKPTTKCTYIKDNNILHTKREDIAETLGKYFSEQYNHNEDFLKSMEHGSTDIIFPTDQEAPYNKPFTMEELQLSLSTSTSKTPGPDNIPYIMLQRLSDEHKISLLAFFNFILNEGFPPQWKESYTIPIPKPQKNPYLKTSQRPITILNCISKIIEKMITRRLQYYLERISFFAPEQSGFRSNHSTLDALIRLEHDARNAILEGKFCVAVFLDIAKAFDSVWHKGLLQKLKEIGITAPLAKYIQQFLTERSIKVKISSYVSTPYPLLCGVPQGSVLSPTLFSIFINDIFSAIPHNVKSSLYADDGALWCTDFSLTKALASIQGALNSVSQWTKRWGLKITPEKTQTMIFTLRQINNFNPIQLHGKKIPNVTNTKFLGVTFDTRLTWKQHITTTRDKCLRDLQLLRVVACNRWGSDYSTLKRLYTTLILPKIDYASILLHSASPSSLLVLDRIQYAATRTILGALKCTPTYKLEAEADIMPLTIRRRLLMAQYGTRICRIVNHPVRNLITTPTLLLKHLGDKYILPAANNITNVLNNMKLYPNKIATIPLYLRYNTHTLPVYHTLAQHNKHSLTNAQWKHQFKTLRDSKYRHHADIYTDGALSNGRCGCGVWSDNFSIKARLPPQCSVFTAELYALYCCIKFISNIPGKYIIFCDSLSAVKALQSLAPSQHYMLYRIIDTLLSVTDVQIAIEWVPSHVGIHGNEQADLTANTSLSLPTITNIMLPEYEIKNHIRAHFGKMWSDSWTSKPMISINFKPTLGPTCFAEEERSLQVSLTRLRLETCLITHKHHFSKQIRRTCHHCRDPITPAHILIGCPHVSHLRKTIKQFCNNRMIPYNFHTVLSGEIPAELLRRYLSEAGYLSQL